MKPSRLDNLMGTRRTLRWRIIIVLLTAALLPLALAGIGSWVVFGNLLEDKSLDQMLATVESHARAIESHLAERVHLLQLAAQTNSPEELIKGQNLSLLLGELNRLTGDGFADLGVIDSNGAHLAYVGPYDLRGQNYKEAEWFHEVTVSGMYVSDVFLGVRQVPHCIIAVRTLHNGHQWILRGTINGKRFDDLVKTPAVGEDVDAFLINREGRYQTTPREGHLLDTAVGISRDLFKGVRNRRVELADSTLIRVTTWLNNQRWMLVVQQPLAAVQAPVNRAIADGALVVAFAVLLLIITTFFATWYLTNRIEKANAEREEMTRAFVRSAKLASIGELATGLAHEINNPLAIISAEQTNISDLLQDGIIEPDWRKQSLASVERCRMQVQRCANITQKMLQFGRKRESTPEPTLIAPRLHDIVDLLRRHASVRNVTLRAEIEPDLPKAVLDPVELEQVLVNLINNSIDAMPGGGEIVIAARRDGDDLQLSVTDGGTGIPSEILERIFEPFFTTKPVGKGTGLGLSVCYGIVTSWGGTIKAVSMLGQGTVMTVTVPTERAS